MDYEIPFDERKCRHQLLSFNFINEYMRINEKPFSDIQQRILKIKDKDGAYTNLAHLISDQNPKIIRVIVYDDNEMVNVDKKMEFSGSIIKQYEDIITYLEGLNRSRFSFVGQHREEVWDYPIDSLNQTLLNMLVHTDYEVKEANVIKIFTDRIEFNSFGGLPNGITFDDLFVGMSVNRNKAVAHFFRNIDLISSFGLGIGIIRDNYSRSLAYPKIRVNDNIFKVVLPNQHYGFEDGGAADVRLSLAETNKMLDVLAALKQKRALSKKEIQELLKVSSTRATIIVNHLVDKELLLQTETELGNIVYTRPR